MNKNKNRTRRTLGILTALMTLSLAAETSTYAQKQPKSNPTAAVKQLASFGNATLPHSDNASTKDYTSGPREAKEAEAFLDAFFAKDAIKQKAGAVTVSVVQDGKVLVSKGYGVTDQTSKSLVDASQTTFRIASISKVFTAAAIMQLVDQGEISLQDNIEKYLDGYKVTSPFDTPVTIENLLTHSTGFEVREPTDASYLTDASQKPISLKESIFDQFPPVVRKPGTSYMYDNFASRLQGYIVQQVSGEPFGSYMEKHLFGPLGMTSSSFSLTKDLVGRLVTSYDEAGSAIPVYDFSPSEWPEGSMVSTASDMALFMKAFLNDGRAADGTVILSPESVKAMSTYHMAIHPDVPDMTYGFESPVAPSNTNGEDVISKGGDILGFSSLLWLLPERKTGVFVSYNANQDLRNDLFTAFMDHYYAGRKSAVGPEGFQPLPKEVLAKFEGLYSDLRIKLLTKVEATGDGTLMVSDVSSRHELKQVDDLLFVDEEGKSLAFKKDADGRITYLKYSNLFSYAAKIPEDQEGFPDVSADYPYASYILGLKSLGFLTDDLSKPFQPWQVVTRGAFIHAFNAIWSIPQSPNPSSFKDIENSPYRKDIQAALESGLLNGTGEDLFEPDRPIRREEAAAIVYRLLAGSGIRVSDSTAVLAPGTSKWAVDAVSSAVIWKLHGPEVTESNGRFDYGSQRALNKQELAALLFTMLLPD
ncbi:serine hydrolase [Paenibacillus eucommiae]|uniref:CubicO group peptidase (Beta-lactamase class C family) n=1 Tax=Paenibacillus eucommiae TaxID=1355755 RepID=A0ABS4JEB3_9BACL|nr:serine hydrolase [Paenibacillus eucommiae]MBP1997064.1 CubicO group peptidase (beta-lactamase class C family) [Paenibacillus eucommiae]